MAADRIEAEISKIAQLAAAVDSIVIPHIKLENVTLQSLIEHLYERAEQLRPPTR
jgi:ribosomal protein L18E